VISTLDLAIFIAVSGFGVETCPPAPKAHQPGGVQKETCLEFGAESTERERLKVLKHFRCLPTTVTLNPRGINSAWPPPPMPSFEKA